MSSTDDFGLPDRGQAKGGDPWTAQEAARLVRPGSQRRLLLEAHRENPKGMTDEEAAEAAGISLASEYATRCSELKAARLLVDTGKSREGAAGMQRMIRRITGEGIIALADPPVVSPLRGGHAVQTVGITDTGEMVHRDPWGPDQPTDPNYRLVQRPGKPDQYINVRKAESQASTARLQQTREDEVSRQKQTPRVEPSTHRLTFGGPVLCRSCKGTGGSLWEACLRCSGTGLT